jgi:SAM-dependent methyltransferase
MKMAAQERVESTVDPDVKGRVREFYDRVGWREGGEGVYQNARYEDLRPVSQEYIHRCHMRVNRHLKPSGRFMLDAGSGPIQYPEYLTYSQGYAARVCVDISEVALVEARQLIGDRASGGHGLFVVADIANLPFAPGIFDGAVTLHTIHHLPEEEHPRAYDEIYRVLAPESTAVVVNGWNSPPLMRLFDRPIRLANRLRSLSARFNGGAQRAREQVKNEGDTGIRHQKGTFVSKNNPAALRKEAGSRMPLRILVWRSVSVRFLRAFVHPRLAGAAFLRLLFWLEERFPEYFGVNGQYPLIVIRKPE